MAASTRPLTLGEILDHTVQLYRRSFLLFVGISIVPSAMYVLSTGSATLYFARHNFSAQSAKPTPEAFILLGFVALLFFLVGLPVLVSVSAITASSLNHAVMTIHRGASATVRASFAYGFRHFWRHLGILSLQLLFALVIPSAVGTGLIVLGGIAAALIAGAGGSTGLAVVMGLLVFLLVIVLFVVCVLIWLRVCLAFPANGVEGNGAWASIKRSNLLSKGTRGRLFVMYLMVTVLTVVVYYMLTLPADAILKLTLYKSMGAQTLFTKPPLVVQVVGLVVSCLERAFVLPIYAIALFLFYVDQRTRHEGYDIEQLMATAGWSDLPLAFPEPEAAAASYQSPYPSAYPAESPSPAISSNWHAPTAIDPLQRFEATDASNLAEAPAKTVPNGHAEGSEA